MIVEIAEFACEVIGIGFDWLGSDDDEKREHPRPVAETLYEERQPTPDTGMTR